MVGPWFVPIVGLLHANQLDAVRAVAVDFSAPFAVRDFTYLVPADSSIRSAATADRRGVRIAVVRAHASTFALSHIVKQAELVQTESLDAALDLLRTGQVHLLASARQDLVRYSTRLPGSRVLEDRYGSSQAAMAIAKGHPGWLAYISEFVEEAKASGLVRQILDRAGQTDAQVAPPGNPKVSP